MSTVRQARVTARGEIWTLESRTRYGDCEAIRLRSTAPDATNAVRTLLHPFDRIVPLPPRTSPHFVSQHRWARSVLGILARERRFGGIFTAAAARIEILPFQLEPALAVLRHGHTRLLISDEVGLGKTVQAGLVMAELSARSASFRGLVLAPAALIDQWTSELRLRFDLDTVRGEAEWLFREAKRLPPDVNPWSLPGIYVASIDLVKRPEVLRPLEDVTWDVVVIDEAHGAAPGTARRAAAHAIATRSRRVVLMTATPPDGDPPQLAALTAIGALDDPVLRFRRARADIASRSARRTVLLHVRLSSAERRMHRLLGEYTTAMWSEAKSGGSATAALLATLLRKRALSSAMSLATSIRRRMALLEGVAPQDSTQQLLLPLGEEDAVSDAPPDDLLGCPALVDTAREKPILQRLERLANVAAQEESKLKTLIRLLRRVRQPAIVFTEYRDTLATIEAAIRTAGRAAVLLHGGMTVRERSHAVQMFNEERMLLLATDAASEGLNLHHHCRIVIHFELPWTLTRLEQRTGRVDRLGQTATVHEILLIARSTAERLVLLPLLERARAAGRRGNSIGARLLTVSESSVAEGVIDGRPIDLPPDSAAAAGDTRFRQESEEEATRIQLERRTRAHPINHPHGVVVTSGRREASTRVRLLVENALRRHDGTCWHSELVLLQFCAPWNGNRRRSALRSYLASLTAERWSAIAEAARSQTARSIEIARRHRTAVLEALNRRDRAMLHFLPSTARHLVQVGLFDRRALKALERQKKTTASLMDDVRARAEIDGDVSETDEVNLLAVQIGDRR